MAVPPKRGINVPSFSEDRFDLDRHKRNIFTVARAKAHNRKLNRQIKAGRIVLMLAAVPAAVFLFWAAVQIISLF